MKLGSGFRASVAVGLLSLSSAQAGSGVLLVLSSTSTFLSSVTHTPLHLVTVRGVEMLPVRFLKEDLRIEVDYDLLWNVFSVDGMHFRVGESELHLYAPKTGGNLIERYALPAPPTVVEGRLYVPLDAVLRATGHPARRGSDSTFLIPVQRERGAAVLPPAVAP